MTGQVLIREWRHPRFAAAWESEQARGANGDEEYARVFVAVGQSVMRSWILAAYVETATAIADCLGNRTARYTPKLTDFDGSPAPITPSRGTLFTDRKLNREQLLRFDSILETSIHKANSRRQSSRWETKRKKNTYRTFHWFESNDRRYTSFDPNGNYTMVQVQSLENRFHGR